MLNKITEITDNIMVVFGSLEKFSDFVRSIKGTSKKLLLCAIILIAISVSIEPFLLLLGNLLPQHTAHTIKFIQIGMGGTSIALFLLSLLISPTTADPSRISAQQLSSIKGLLSFEESDAPFFRTLERLPEIVRISQMILNEDFRFGILCAPSGTGKSSFIKAGLLPELRQQLASAQTACYTCLYVKLNEHDPLDSIRFSMLDALKSITLPEATPIDTSTLQQAHNLHHLLEAAIPLFRATRSTPLILVLDQFEQFFVHRKKEEEQMPFIEGVNHWYRSMTLSQTVKIIVSLRADFLWKMEAFQRHMDYVASQLNQFTLKKFEPLQAARIFEAIAKKADIHYEKDFIESFCQQKLADKDGKISPVDIQIVMMMFSERFGQDKVSFSAKTLDQLDGIERLLADYIQNALEKRESDKKRQVAIHVMLALIEGDTRSKALSSSELQEKLTSLFSPEEVLESIEWLNTNRLINPCRNDIQPDVKTYELAHERLIGAIRLTQQRIVAQSPMAQKLTLLLDKLAREWVNSSQSAQDTRYYLSWRQCRAVLKHEASIDWGQNETIKRNLLARSLSYRRKQFLIPATLLLVATSGAYIYRQTTTGHIFLTQYRLKQQINPNVELRTQLAAVRALDAIGETEDALKAFRDTLRATNNFNDSENIETAFKLHPQIAKQALTETLASAQKINDDSSKTETLSRIAEVAVKIHPEIAQQALTDALAAAQKIDNDLRKAQTFSRIAKVAARIHPEIAKQALTDALTAASQTIDDDSFKADTLSDIAKTATQIHPEIAQQALTNALTASQKINDDPFKANLLSDIAKIAAKTHPTIAKQAITDALAISQKINEGSGRRGSTLLNIAGSTAQIYPEIANQALTDSIAIAQKINDHSWKANIFLRIAKTAAKTQPEIAKQALADAIASAQKINDDYSKASALSDIADAIAKTHPEMAKQALTNAIAIVQKISDDSGKANVLLNIADATAKLPSPLAKPLLASLVESTATIKNINAHANLISKISIQTKDIKYLNDFTQPATPFSFNHFFSLSNQNERLSDLNDYAFVNIINAYKQFGTDGCNKAYAIAPTNKPIILAALLECYAQRPETAKSNLIDEDEWENN